jgi:hypothetical protein
MPVDYLNNSIDPGQWPDVKIEGNSKNHVHTRTERMFDLQPVAWL